MKQSFGCCDPSSYRPSWYPAEVSGDTRSSTQGWLNGPIVASDQLLDPEAYSGSPLGPVWHPVLLTSTSPLDVWMNGELRSVAMSVDLVGRLLAVRVSLFLFLITIQHAFATCNVDLQRASKFAQRFRVCIASCHNFHYPQFWTLKLSTKCTHSYHYLWLPLVG